MKLNVPHTHFQAASTALRLTTPPVEKRHTGMEPVMSHLQNGRWESTAGGIVVYANRNELFDATVDFWLSPPQKVHGSEVLGTLALTSALLPQTIARLACQATPIPRRFGAIRRIIEAAEILPLPQKIIKLYMIAGGHRGAAKENALGGALVRWLGLENSAWQEIRTSIDTLGVTPGMCVTIARHLFEEGQYEEAAALLLSELEYIAIADVAEPGFVEAAMASGTAFKTPPEIFRAAELISRMLPLIGCDRQNRMARLDNLRGWLAAHQESDELTFEVDGMVVERTSAELCVRASQPIRLVRDEAANIAVRCLHTLTAEKSPLAIN